MIVRQPPEWAPQQWIWIGFPHLADEWPDALEAAQSDIAAFARAVARGGETVRLVCRDGANAAIARALLGDAPRVEIYELPYGDVWMRDTGPLIVRDNGALAARRFGFNGWGGKYEMPGDQEIGGLLADQAGLAAPRADWILEGGAIDTDGTGLVVTTEQCLLNPNRNPHLSRADIEARLARDLGFDRVLWLGEGLVNDHTDGHVDNLARFVAPGVLAIPCPSGNDDPNAAIFADAEARARAFGVETVRIPSPGRVEVDGEVQPASHMNFAIVNGRVIVPLYDTAHDGAALEAIGRCFPDREVIGRPAHGLLAGGGSFHCASQQMPAA